jgi:transposase
LAAVIIAELGVDMSVFQTISQLVSWAGVCPGNNESAGKRKSSRIAKGNVYLKTAFVEAANSATKAKGTYLRDKLYRLKARRGYKRAAVALAHKTLSLHQSHALPKRLLQRPWRPLPG